MVIDVAADRRTARRRAGVHDAGGPARDGRRATPRAWWEGGIYENEYVRERGVWKIKALRYFPFWHGSFADGWQKTPIDFIPMAKALYPQDPLGPDALITPHAAPVAGHRYGAVPLPASGHRQADRARQQPRARRVQGWMRRALARSTLAELITRYAMLNTLGLGGSYIRIASRRTADDVRQDRLPGAELAHQPSLLGTRQELNTGIYAPYGVTDPQCATRRPVHAR